MAERLLLICAITDLFSILAHNLEYVLAIRTEKMNNRQN